MHGPQMPGGAANPVGERRTVERDALPGVDLRLTIERQMVCIFGDQHMGDGRLRRQTTFDQSRRGRRLDDGALAGAAGVLGTPRHQNTELSRNDVEPLGNVFADPMQRALAAWAGLVVDIDDGLDARQMCWQGAAVRAALSGCLLTFRRRTGFRFRRRASLCLLDLFERKQHLVFRERLGAPPEAVSLHLLDDLNCTSWYLI